MGGYKLKVGKFRLDIEKKFFTAKVVRHWNALRREVVDVPSVKVLEIGLDGTTWSKGRCPYPWQGIGAG